ncbi:MAG: AsmA family protein [Rickettsia endosymbiont of Ixodes persulcatus]|nr:AsmA family protein [Rickettsia endosymbiont of Ixodes persulcatus]MCZ6909306.1 AsmA family protein [Rickettsia endosymbiont of Ixodes persulcatus]MCZ6910453.1 AsmA family protein [Rickettsia endosymbiont of Ixodes persulcatus]MCZ6913923.1 AsmA family protein [Rickettsia endosymbiont of Ixodes persulcatus]MCZ6925948.1 AsmA family protein [Rickettsia endosymbiont of Ixodes persulcatus]
MPKALKYSLIIFISIILLLIVITFFIPLNNYKGVIIDKVKEATNRDLTINGDIKLSLLPNPTISLSEIKLSSIDGTKEPHLVSVESAKASLRLFSLFRGAIEVASIELQKPIINLEVLNNGQKKWQFAAPNNNPKINNVSSAESTNTKTELELPILISHFKIIDGKVIYIEKNNGKIFNDINLDTKIKSLKGPIDFTLALKALEQQINIDGNIAKIGKIIMLSADINLAGEKIKIEGKFDSENNSFIGNANIKGNTKTLGMPADLQNDYELTTAITADSKNIAIKDTRLNYTNIELLANTNYDIERNNLKSNIIINPGNIITEISSNLDKTNILLQADILKPILDALKLKTDKLPPIINQKLILTSSVVYNSQAIKLQNINLSAANSNLTGDIELKNLAQDITISHNLKINNFESFMTLLGVNNLNRIGVFQLNGEVQKVKDTFRINNKISAFNTNMSIKGDINLAVQKLNFNLNLYSPLVNLEKIISSNSPTAAPNKTNSPATQNIPTPKNNSPWSNNPINLEFLNEIEGQISASIDKLTNDSLIINNLKTKFNITGGKLNITSVNTSIYGGELNSTGFVNSGKDQNIAIKIDLKNAYLKNLTPQSGKIKITDGRLSFKADLNSSGNSVYTYINNLNGQFNVNSDNGKISGFDLNRIADAVNNAKNTEGVLQLINSSFSGGSTSFKNLIASGNITQGKLKLNECSLDASPAKANASGQINLPQYMMDISASVTISDLPPIAVKLYGFINNPQHKLDIQALQTYLVKNVFNSVIKDLKSREKKPENIIKDALGLRKKKDSNVEEQSNTKLENQQADPVNKLLQKGLEKLF